MALEEYERKRDFKKTPEPSPERAAVRAQHLSYLIQKHDATRLHYDFRLELDGVLLSWAVTKGPSLNPADKRLAVRTEDHPLSYGTFEGTIPKGQYGGGTVMLWDEGTWEPTEDPHAGLKKGHLSFLLHGERLKGAWDLIRMRGDRKRENWLLIKKNDAQAELGSGDVLDKLTSSVESGRSMEQIATGAAPARKASSNKNPATAKKPATTASQRAALKKLVERYPDVQLATLVEQPPAGDQWLHEIKLDGYRLLGFVARGAVCLRTRNGNDWTARFPAIAESLESLKATDAVLDMEAVVMGPDGKSSFQALQAALGEGGQRNSIAGYAFDLLHLNGKNLTKKPLRERKQLLEGLLRNAAEKALRYSEHIVGEGERMFAQSCSMGLEGIVSKQADSPYATGRQKTWLKIKCALRQEFIIIGYSDPRSGARSLGALYLGYGSKGEMKYAGKVGTGFSMKSARSLTERLEKLAMKDPVLSRSATHGMTAKEWQAVHWVKPELLCEVAFTEWTQDGQLRHPSFQGLREDKSADEVKQEKPLPGKISSPPPASKPGSLVLAGVRITHPDRLISDTAHITKGDLAEYYETVAPFMLRQIARHPISLLRCPDGMERPCFYQRDPRKGMGPDVHPFEFKNKGKTYEYLYIEDQKGLLELVQMGAVEIHPWGSSVDAVDRPDWLIFDLDPAPDVPFEAVKLAAQDLRQRLKVKGLVSTLKCSGGKGLHVTVPLAARDEWPKVKSFAAAVAGEMVSAAPDAYIATMSKAKRDGKIFVDYFRNDYTATAIADYAVRARPGAPVAVPLEWSELDDLKSASQFTMQEVLKRLARKKPPGEARQQAQRIPAR